MLVFGADHWAQNRSFKQRKMRHELPQHATWIAVGLAMALAASTLNFNRADWHWWLSLGLGGAVYTLLASNRSSRWIGCKEALGSVCFAWLVWGRVPQAPFESQVAFWLLALSNLCWSSHFDRARDLQNAHVTLATRWPRATRLGARAAAAAAVVIFIANGYSDQLGFLAVAIAHLAWPSRHAHIDWSFLALVLGFTVQG